MPGVVKAREGKVAWAPNFRDQWKDVQVAQPVQEALGLPVHIGNDANLAALGEFRFGVGRDGAPHGDDHIGDRHRRRDHH